MKPFRPCLAYYHANARGTGSAAKFHLHPATIEGDGEVSASFAAQKTAGGRHADGSITFPTFDWNNKVAVSLSFLDIAKMLEVFRGCKEKLEDGNGLVHLSENAKTVFKLSHVLEPVGGYSVEVCRKAMQGAESTKVAETKIGFFFSYPEALSFCLALESSMSLLAFGVPQVLPCACHDDNESK